MNTSRMRRAIDEIERLETALRWLSEFGVKISKHEGVHVRYHPNFAGSCNGAKEAGDVLSAMMTNDLPNLIPKAIENCRNTIQIHREILRDESIKDE